MRILRATGNGQRATTRGFTLIEVTVAVAIMVLLVTVVVPQIGDLAQVQMRSTARRLAGTIRHTYFTAVLTKKNYVLNYDLDKNEYWVGEAVYNPELEAIEQKEITRGLGRKRKLPEGVVFATVEVEEGGSRSKGIASTYFSNLGVATHTLIDIKDRKGRIVRLEIPTYGGRPRVGQP